jgi:S-adenosylmethionine synthetase
MIQSLVFDIHIMRRNEMMVRPARTNDRTKTEKAKTFFIELIKSNEMYKKQSREREKRSGYITGTSIPDGDEGAFGRTSRIPEKNRKN